jgi:RNA polymerase sigma factor (sigma-70 family)
VTQNLDDTIRRAVAGDRNALEAVVVATQDDVYRLCLRMLGSQAEAQDCAQEILIKIVTRLSTFRGESAFRTWVWTIGTRHVMAFRRGALERTVDFASIEAMIDAGAGATPIEDDEAEIQRLAEEVRLGCTQAMLVALDRNQRVVYVLSDIFALTSEQVAEVVAIAPPVARKRLQRAREELGAFMQRKCGIVNPVAACRCVRQLPVLVERGIIERRKLPLVDHPRREVLEHAWQELGEIDAIARLHRDHPEYAAPEGLLMRVRELLDSGRYRLLSN